MKYVKYPKTFHLPWSEGITSDDKVMVDDPFEGKNVVITEKMDGENTTLYRDHIHARSLDSGHHPSRDWVKSFWGQICWKIPENFRVCGENMYAKHSIFYDDLDSYFLGFSVWDGDTCLNWHETQLFFSYVGITPVPVLYAGIHDRSKTEEWWRNVDPNDVEGYVIRLYDSFNINDFPTSVGKFVRKNHVQTTKFWRNQPITPNKLRKEPKT